MVIIITPIILSSNLSPEVDVGGMFFLLHQWTQSKSSLILYKPTLWLRFLNPVLGGGCVGFMWIRDG